MKSWLIILIALCAVGFVASLIGGLYENAIFYVVLIAIWLFFGKENKD